MPVVQGTISGSIKSFTLNVPSRVVSFSLFNRSGGSVTARVGIVISGRDVYVWGGAIASGESEFVPETEIKMLAGSQILIVSSGELDYYFTINPIE